VEKVMLVSGHYLESKRKAGFHWLADSYRRMGREVVFVTAPISRISWLRKDYRFDYPVLKEANRLKKVDEGLSSFIYFTFWHPAQLRNRILNALTYSLYVNYGRFLNGELEKLIRDCSLIIFESTPALLLFKHFKKINPTARYVYRVSDDVKLLNYHPIVIEEEEKLSSQFDLISTPSSYIHQRFIKFPNAELHYHGIRKDEFDKKYKNPYDGGINAVFVGNSHFDYDFLERAAKIYPEWKFHIIGPITRLPKYKNVITYGELSFKDTIPYVKYADVGLHNLLYTPGSESFTDSLKVIQYTYCQLPFIAPSFLKTCRPHSFYYEYGNTESIRQVLQNAYSYDRTKISTEEVYSWDELAIKLEKGEG
jgi:2-beta-glucuronyltransferase